jgi:hypothetical protein
MQKAKYTHTIAFTEFLQQFVIFLSLCCTFYFGMLRLDYTHFKDTLWVLAALAIAFFARKFIRKFWIFVFSNVLILVISYYAGSDETQVTLNLLIAFIMCVYSTSLKNREVQIYKDSSIPIHDGQTVEEVRNAALRSLVAKEAVSMWFIAVIVVGYFVGAAADSSFLMNIQGIMCILFIILQILHGNLKSLKQEYDLNGAKKDFPAQQMMSVSRFVTFISLLLVALGMIIFFNGYYGNIFAYIGAGFKFIFKIFGRIFMFLLGLSGSKSTTTGEQTTEAATEPTLTGDLAMDDNDFMELLAEIFGAVLIVALIAGIIYVIKVYASNFNRVKKVGTDTVEYVSSSERKSRVTAYDAQEVHRESRSAKSVRKIYKKSVVSGMKDKKPNVTLPPEELTKAAITDDDARASGITRIYEKARYSNEEVTAVEYEQFKNDLKN